MEQAILFDKKKCSTRSNDVLICELKELSKEASDFIVKNKKKILDKLKSNEKNSKVA